MINEDLLKEIARLESLNDLLKTELKYVDQLMRLVGFAGGLATVKATALEMQKMNDDM